MRRVMTLLCCLGAAEAQAEPPEIAVGESATLSVVGQLRPRLIVDSGRDFVDGDAIEREYVTQRARLGATLAHREGAAITLVLQDVRTWGEEADTLNDFDADGFDAHEAFVDLPLYQTAGKIGATLRLGRQEIVLDDARLVGNVGWTQRARSFDGARAMWRGDGFGVDGFFTLVTETDQDPDGHVPADPNRDDRWFAGLHGDVRYSEALGGSLLFLTLQDDVADATRHTVGGRVTGAAAGASWEGAFYYQLGSLGDADISALLGAARVGYVFPVALKPALAVWGEYLSGDGSPESAFDTLFATNHKFYGEMDFFLAIPRQTSNLGLTDFGGRVGVRPWEPVGAHVDVHVLSTAEDDPAGERALGTEVDLKVVWQALPNVALRALYGIYLPGEAIESTRGVTDPADEHLFYLTVDATL